MTFSFYSNDCICIYMFGIGLTKCGLSEIQISNTQNVSHNKNHFVHSRLKNQIQSLIEFSELNCPGGAILLSDLSPRKCFYYR